MLSDIYSCQEPSLILNLQVRSAETSQNKNTGEKFLGKTDGANSRTDTLFTCVSQKHHIGGKSHWSDKFQIGGNSHDLKLTLMGGRTEWLK